jgi:hypothetical protein
LKRVISEVSRQDESTLRQTLKSDKVEMRFAAAYVVGDKKIPIPQPLIDTLGDSNEDVQQMARRSLVLLGCYATTKQPTDETTSAQKAAAREVEKQVNRLIKLGPSPTKSKTLIASASKKWTDWWEKNDPHLEKLKAAVGSRDKPGQKQ